MNVRNSAKAIVLHNGRILVNRCTSCFGEYFALPGGGQHVGELLTETVRRELLEETGYAVEPLRMTAVYERVNRNRSDGNGHKIYFIFLCRLLGEQRRSPTETDRFQIGYEWVPMEELLHSSLFPRAIRDSIPAMLATDETIFIGSERD